MGEHLIGVISDTHGSVHPDVVGVFEGVEMILHAGDIGGPNVMSSLQSITSVTVVRGNTDNEGAARSLLRTQTIQIGEVLIHMQHSLDYFDIDPAKAGIGVVVFGHTHRPTNEVRDGVLFLNPGSVSRPRGCPPSVALLRIEGGKPAAEIRTLE